MIVDLAIAMVVGIRTDSFMYMDIDMSMFIRSKTPLNFVFWLTEDGQFGPTTVQNRFKNGPTWCQNGVQDGLLGIRAVKRRILDRDATATPIHEAVLEGLLGSCWGSCWAHVDFFSW